MIKEAIKKKIATWAKDISVSDLKTAKEEKREKGKKQKAKEKHKLLLRIYR